MNSYDGFRLTNFLNDFTSNNFSFYAMDDDGKDLNCKYEEISEWPVNIKS